jgi:uncharacterized membrane protein
MRSAARRSRLVGGVRAAGLVLLGAGAAHGQAAPAAGPPSDAEILALVKTHCAPCHAAEPTHEAFAKPPAGIMLETIAQVTRYAPKIMTQVIVERAMPLGNQTAMTEQERARIGSWIESRRR